MDGGTGLQIREQRSGSGSTCRTILGTLPTWFGVPESVDDYVAAAERLTTFIATVDGEDVGVLTVMTHSPFAAEVYMMAVRPEHHRHGIGHRLLARAEDALVLEGIEYLQVKTLSARSPDEGYRATREFYLSCGFRPLQEFPDLWSPENPALQMIKSLRREAAT